MNTTIGIVKDVDACAGIAESWPRGVHGGPEVVVSPPASLDDMGGRSSLIVLAGPDDRLPEAVAALRPVVGPAAAIVSTSPVVSLEVLRSLAGIGPALFRAVIPLGTEPGEGAVALAPEVGTPQETVERVKAALAWIGVVEVVTEDALDAVAALVLGGASFLAEALQGMEEGAVSDGLPRETARAFAHQTALATALLLRDHSGSPADLKDQVASPGGTTIAALASLEDRGVRGAYIRAVQRTAVEVRKRRHAAPSSVVE
jgi:pyrroline-5-carboxylate reductase